MMRDKLKTLFYRLTGGRPMKLIGFAFTDVVDGQAVNYYIDKFDRVWMANSRWSRFRVTRREYESLPPIYSDDRIRDIIAGEDR